VHEDELAKKQEIVECRTHSHQKRSHTKEKAQNGTAAEEIVEVSATWSVSHTSSVHIDVSGESGSDELLANEIGISVGISEVDIGGRIGPHLQLAVGVVSLRVKEVTYFLITVCWTILSDNYTTGLLQQPARTGLDEEGKGRVCIIF